jgi:Fructose-1-6-bisphosphatase, C-terminal domain
MPSCPPTVGEFFLSHENIRIPESGKTYSINEGNHAHWTEPVRRWNAWIKEDDKPTGRPYGQRYVGSLVADAHRTLLKGGIFAYPADTKNAGGKLRLSTRPTPSPSSSRAPAGRPPPAPTASSTLHARVPCARWIEGATSSPGSAMTSHQNGQPAQFSQRIGPPPRMFPLPTIPGEASSQYTSLLVSAVNVLSVRVSAA